MQVRVLRAFFLGGKVQEVGSEIDVPKSLADDLIYVRKAALVKDAPPAQTMTTESAKAIVAGPPHAAPKGKFK
jgi:hypothetical protein